MTLTWRRARALEIDHEALWLLVGSASLCLLGVALVTPGIQLPRCVFKTITGLPCPTCGVTRTIIALSRGDVDRAPLPDPLAAIACGSGSLSPLCGRGARLAAAALRPTVSAPGARRCVSRPSP